MKARRKGTDAPFKDVNKIGLKDSDILYNADVVEFQGDANLLLGLEPTPDENHWQEVRERAAIAAMQGTITILSNSDRTAFREIVVDGFRGNKKTYPNEIAEFAYACANALIEQLEKNEK